jgi:hypothetical protein
MWTQTVGWGLAVAEGVRVGLIVADRLGRAEADADPEAELEAEEVSVENAVGTVVAKILGTREGGGVRLAVAVGVSVTEGLAGTAS